MPAWILTGFSSVCCLFYFSESSCDLLGSYLCFHLAYHSQTALAGLDFPPIPIHWSLVLHRGLQLYLGCSGEKNVHYPFSIFLHLLGSRLVVWLIFLPLVLSSPGQIGDKVTLLLTFVWIGLFAMRTLYPSGIKSVVLLSLGTALIIICFFLCWVIFPLLSFSLLSS